MTTLKRVAIGWLILVAIVFVVSRGHGYGSVKEGEKVQHAIEAEKSWEARESNEREAASQAAIARAPQPPEETASIEAAKRTEERAARAVPIEGRWRK